MSTLELARSLFIDKDAAHLTRSQIIELAQAVIDLSAESARGSISQHDALIYQAFWEKHALGSKSLPSCFKCGQAKDQREWATTHAELPDIYLCKQCAAAPTNPREGKCTCGLTPTGSFDCDKRVGCYLWSEVRGAAPAEAERLSPADIAELTRLIVLGVAEIPDRDSPDDHPEMMLVTDTELRSIVRQRLEDYAAPVAPSPEGEPKS